MSTKKKDSKWVYALFIMALLLVNLIGIFYLVKNDKENKKLDEEKMKITALYDKTLEDLDLTQQALEEKENVNQTLDSTLKEQKKILISQRGQISKLLRNAGRDRKKIAEAEALISKFRATAQMYENQIQEMIQRNEDLYNQTVSLTKKIDTVNQVNKDLTGEIDQLNKQLDENKYVSVYNLDMSGIRIRRSGKEVPVEKVRFMNKLKISFLVGENKLIKPGKLPLKIRLIDPTGKEVVNKLGGGGVFQTSAGKTVKYTKQIGVDYKNKAVNSVVYLSNGFDQSGIYKVEVYHDDVLLAQAEKEFK